VSAATFDRLRNPAAGRGGGRPGAPGAARLASGRALETKSVHVVPPGDRLVLELPGGGGMGDPAQRDATRVEADVASGLVSEERAARDYPARK
jgi:N-methylhydantoinase B